MYEDDDDDFKMAAKSFSRKQSSPKMAKAGSKLAFVLKKAKPKEEKKTVEKKAEVPPEDDGLGAFGEMEESRNFFNDAPPSPKENPQNETKDASPTESEKPKETVEKSPSPTENSPRDDKPKDDDDVSPKKTEEAPASDPAPAPAAENSAPSSPQSKPEPSPASPEKKEKKRATFASYIPQDDDKEHDLSPRNQLNNGANLKRASSNKSLADLAADPDLGVSLSGVDLRFSSSFSSPMKQSKRGPGFDASMNGGGGSIAPVNPALMHHTLKSLCMSFSKRQIGVGEDKAIGKRTAPVAFDHNLPPTFGDDYFALLQRHQQNIEDEDLKVCNDMVAACRHIESQQLWNPAKDTLNSQMQTLLQQPLRELLKGKSWEQLKFCRDTYVREFVQVLEQIGNFNELPNFLQVGSSWLLPDRNLMVHVWQSHNAARRFYNGWSRIWQVLFEARIMTIHAPVSILYHAQGAYCSVTALPPVLASTHEPFMAPGSASGPMLSFYAKSLISSLFIPATEIPLYAAADGRYYLMTTQILRQKSVPNMPDHVTLQPLLRDHFLDASVSTLDVYMRDVACPRVVDALIIALECRKPEERRVEPLIKDRIVVRACHDRGVNLNKLYTLIEICQKRLQALGGPKEGLHYKEGRDEAELAQAAEEADKGYADAERTKSAVEYATGGAEDDDAPSDARVLQRQEHLKTHPYSIAASDLAAVLKRISPTLMMRHLDLIMRLVTSEMVARTVKDLVRLDLNYGAGNVPHNTEGARINVVNRFARLLVSSHPFWRNQIAPRLREKFKTPSDFFVDPHLSSPSSVLRHVATRVGVAFHPQSGRFGSFSAIGEVWCTLFDPQDLVERTLQKVYFIPQMKDLWQNIRSIMAEEREAMVMRATCLSLVSRCCSEEVKREWDAVNDAHAGDPLPSGREPGSAIPTAAPFRIHMAMMMIELEVILKKPPQTFELHNKLIRTLTHPTDMAFMSAMLIESAILRGQAKHQKATDLELFRDGFIQFLALDHVDFTYSFMHTSALRELQSQLSRVKAPREAEMILEVLAGAAETLHAMNRIPNAAKLLRESLILGLRIPAVEQTARAGSVATQCYGAHVISYGRNHPRSILAAMLLAYYATTCKMERSPRVKSIKSKVMQVIKNTLVHYNKPKKQIGIAKGNTVLLLFHRVAEFLSMNEDEKASKSLMAHVLHHAHPNFPSAMLLQRVARGFSQRKRLAAIPR